VTFSKIFHRLTKPCLLGQYQSKSCKFVISDTSENVTAIDFLQSCTSIILLAPRDYYLYFTNEEFEILVQILSALYFKKFFSAGHWLLTPVILATQEAEIRRIEVSFHYYHLLPFSDCCTKFSVVGIFFFSLTPLSIFSVFSQYEFTLDLPDPSGSSQGSFQTGRRKYGHGSPAGIFH
jgi:hypothetical protein